MTKRTNPNNRSLSGMQCPSFWIDESGSKSTANSCFVVAGIKTRHADDLLRAIKSVRERHGGYAHELKFARITRNSLPVLRDLVDVLGDSDAHIAATVVGESYNPFKRKEHWVAHAEIVAQLVRGNVNRNEVATVYMDGISTPPGRSLGRRVKDSVNRSLGSTVVHTAVSLDSRANDLLQAADLVAGAIFFERHTLTRPRAKEADPEKVQILRRLTAAFGVPSLADQRTDQVNIRTMTAPAQRASGRGIVRVVRNNTRSAS